MSAQPLSSPDTRSELTWRGVIIGVVITVVFTAANVFFGLKAGLTFSTSIPAAVISMAILRYFKNSTIQENNIVQTIASAAGTLSSIIFVLPGMVMIGWWQGFPFGLSFAVCALGGILGVMYSIPLRRALVTNSDLPYPEGVACAEVLKVGSSHEGNAATVEEGKAGLLAVLWGSIVSAVFAVIVATQVFASDIVGYFRVGTKGVSGFDLNLSLALLAIGHLVGLSVGIAMLIGAVIGWGWGVPHYAAMADAAGSAVDVAQDAWAHSVRFVGAGTIAISAIWTLTKLIKPVVGGLASAMAASRVRKAGKAETLPRTEQDIPIGQVGIITLVCFVLVAMLLRIFAMETVVADDVAIVAIGGVAYIVLMGFFVSAICGYMAGLIGSSNSPLSGVGILVVICAALLLVVAGVQPQVSPNAGKALVAFALFTTSVIFTVAAIANNNLQDLKTGQLVDATPWKQQVALIIGVIAGALVIPPVLDLVNHAYGFAGTAGADPHRALAAPQAGLISALAQGVLQGNIDWGLIRVGAIIGAAIIVVDAALSRTTKHLSMPPLAVGLGIYLPTQATLMVVVGAVVGWYFDRRADRTAKPAATKQLGVLLASGLIVGESVIGIVIAAIVAFSGLAAPLALVGPGFAGAAMWIGGVAFAAAVFVLYRWIARLGSAAA